MFRNLRIVLVKMKAEPPNAVAMSIIKRHIAATFVWLLLTEFYLVVQILPVKLFMDELTSPSRDLKKLYLIASSFAVLYKVGTELSKRMSNPRNSVFWGAWSIWWSNGHRAVLRQSNDWHIKHGTGEKDSIVGRNVDKFQNLFDEALFNTIPVLFRITFTTVFMFVIGWQFGLVLIVTGIMYIILMLNAEKHMSPARKEFREDMRRAENKGSELNRGWRTIKNLGLEERFADDNQTLLTEVWNRDIPRHKLYTQYMYRQENITTLSRAVFYFVVGLMEFGAKSPAISFGTVVLASTWMERAYSNFGRLMDFQRQLNEGKEALRELVEFIQLPPTVQSPAHPKWPSRLTGEVEFRNVSFCYTGATNNTLHQFNLHVAANTTVAIVGHSGCGKSTAMSMLLREFDPCEGIILLDGQDLREFDLTRYRQEAVSCLNQTIDLFERSIADNIRLGKLDASFAEIEDAAKAAGAHEFIIRTEQGYNSLIGENGINLSGGQRQRIAIARALIRQPTLLILDEATSSLDALSQAHFQRTIDERKQHRLGTTILIAHRLSTVKDADVVAYMKDGRILDHGPHAELLRSCPEYRALCEIELNLD